MYVYIVPNLFFYIIINYDNGDSANQLRLLSLCHVAKR